MKDYDRIRKMREFSGRPLTATSEKSIFSWRDYYGFLCYEEESFIIIYSMKLHRFLYPFGDIAKGLSFIESLDWETKEKGFCFLDGRQAIALQERGYQIQEDRDSSEYLYVTESLALRSEDISSNLRRKYKKFAKQYPYSVREIDATWLHSFREERYQKKQSEVKGMLEHFTEYEMSGIEIFYENESAYIFGYENTKEMFTLTGIDYSEGFGANAVPVCICEMARRLYGQYKYIDLEEDMGIEGLRRMKMLYKPVFLLEAFYADYRDHTYRSGERKILLP